MLIVGAPAPAMAQGLEGDPVLWLIVLGVPVVLILAVGFLFSRLPRSRNERKAGMPVAIGLIAFWFGSTVLNEIMVGYFNINNRDLVNAITAIIVFTIVILIVRRRQKP